MSWLFDGAEELSNLERGESFGLSKDEYGALAHLSMSAFRWAEIEPCEIRLLHDPRDGQVIPGCDVVLYGRAAVYTVRMDPFKRRSTLFFLPIDSKLGGPGCLLYTHDFAGDDYVGLILPAMLKKEGVDLSSWEEQLRQEEP
jgi:hypothetical protein